MSNRSMLLLLLAATLPAADLASLHPLCPPETAIPVPELAGSWSDFRLEAGSGNDYSVSFEGERVFTARFVRLGGELFADLTYTGKLLDAEMPFHSIARVRVEGDRLRVDWLGSDELEHRIGQPGGPKHERVRVKNREFTVLTASTEALQRFVLDCVERPDSFEDSDTFERAGPELRARELNRSAWAAARKQESPEAHAVALKDAEQAVALVRDNPDYWNTLALALVRAERSQDALGAMVRAESLRGETHAEDLAVRAMILGGLGLTAEGRQSFERLRALMADHSLCDRPDVLALFHEARELAAKGK